MSIEYTHRGKQTLGKICGQMLLPMTCGHSASTCEYTQLIGVEVHYVGSLKANV